MDVDAIESRLLELGDRLPVLVRVGAAHDLLGNLPGRQDVATGKTIERAMRDGRGGLRSVAEQLKVCVLWAEVAHRVDALDLQVVSSVDAD